MTPPKFFDAVWRQEDG
ncbi:hypothetical protein [Sodalis-like endosymbiont of Proechinophthirus fluctus]